MKILEPCRILVRAVLKFGGCNLASELSAIADTVSSVTAKEESGEMDLSGYDAMDGLVRGTGLVCIAASGLEWMLTHLVGLIEDWPDERYAAVLARRDQERSPVQHVRRLAALMAVRFPGSGLEADVRGLADQAQALLERRHRAVHSVMMLGAGGYESWHPRSAETRSADPGELADLAQEIADCAAEVTGFTHAWQTRAERDGWPVMLPETS